MIPQQIPAIHINAMVIALPAVLGDAWRVVCWKYQEALEDDQHEDPVHRSHGRRVVFSGLDDYPTRRKNLLLRIFEKHVEWPEVLHKIDTQRVSPFAVNYERGVQLGRIIRYKDIAVGFAAATVLISDPDDHVHGFQYAGRYTAMLCQ